MPMLTGCVPWPDEVAAIYRARGYWQDQTIPEVFDQLAAQNPDRVILCDQGARITARQLMERSIVLASHFHQTGLSKHDRVVFQLPNGVAFLAAFFALLRIGVIPIMALPPHRESELLHFARFGGAKAILVPEKIGQFDYREMADQVRAGAPALEHVFVLGEALEGQHSLTALAALPARPADLNALSGIRIDPGDVALMLLSGGTTALPKLIPRTHNDYVYNFKQSSTIAGFSEDTVLLAILPMAHNYTLGSPGVLGALVKGGRVVVSPKTDSVTVFSLVEREAVTVIPAAVPLIVNWLNDERLADFDVSSLKLVQNGGARLSAELRRRLRERFGCQFQEDFGTAEGLLNLTRLDDPDDKVLYSSGTPISPDDEIKVLDIDGNEVADGEPGELVVRGPYTIRGYYNAPEINARAFTADGFYRMGDIVRKNGRTITAEGRKNDLINRGGEKISIDEIENYMLKHPAVHSVAVVAMTDAVFGEKVCAFATLNEGQSLTFDALKTFLLDQKIAKFKLPERLEILDEMPISPAGKILRRSLRETIDAKLIEERGPKE